MKRIEDILLIAYCLLMSVSAGAAITMNDLPYLCDFETEDQNKMWGLNPGIDAIQTDNRWVIGSATAYTGEQSMYVSKDGGVSTAYANTNNVLLAYQDITLDQGDYDIAYDWSGLGNGTDGYLKVVFANLPIEDWVKCQGNSVEPNWMSSAVACMGKNVRLNQNDTMPRWLHVEARITIPRALSQKSTTRLLFVWVNTTKAAAPKTTLGSVAIDNVQLAKASATDYPTNISVVTHYQTATISWEGSADSYEVRYRKKTDADFTSVTTTETSVELQNVEYGAYEFWICGINGADKTIYTVFPTVYIYETDCFDALNMYNATFEYGKWKSVANTIQRTVGGTERVDLGYADIRSRHTTHWVQTEYDPRTGNQLKTVPEGHFGSLRLGNWNSGSEYESIRFTYDVKSDDNAVLLLNYAIVLENPDHSAAEQPRFFLTIYNEAGVAVDTKCAQVDFHAPTSVEKLNPELMKVWHQYTYMDGTTSHEVTWQEWRTIGVDLSAYKGQSLTVEFTTYDCDQSGHFGYAYFTLRCSRSDVDGLPWGDGSSTQEFTAPDGFNYAWFNTEDKQHEDTLSTAREFIVQESDTMTYICYATYATNADCGFTMEASAKPHNPFAEIQYEWVPKDCENGIIVRNACHVALTNQITGEVEHRYDKQIDWCRWTMPDGQETEEQFYEGFYVPVSNDGETLEYKIWCGVTVHGVLFESDTTITIVVPAIGPEETHLYDTICRGDEREFPIGSHQMRSETDDYVDALVSTVTGCDSTVYYHLWVHEPIYYDYYDTVCHQDSYVFDGRELARSCEVRKTTTSLVTGCDSIVTLHFTRAEEVEVEVANVDLCGNEPVRLRVSGGEWADSIVVEAPNQPRLCFPARREMEELLIEPGLLRAGQYEATIIAYMPWCQEARQTVHFNISLGANVWNLFFGNVIGLYSQAYNGDYAIASIQWYANGEAIAGATETNYRLPEPVDRTIIYSARVVLEDGTELLICPATLDERQAMGGEEVVRSKEEGIRTILQNGRLYIVVGKMKYDILGQRL